MASSDLPLVSIVVLNWNGEELIRECLESLNDLAYGNVEVVVVDNGSTDRSLQIIASFPNVKLIAVKENIGYAAGNNIGFRKTRGKYIATLNNDAVVKRSWLDEPVEQMELDSSIGIVACRQMNYYRPEIIDCLFCAPSNSLLFGPYGHGKKFSGKYNRIGPSIVIGAGGASAIYRSELIQKAGGFDERLFAYHEESDLCMYAFVTGWKCVYLPSSQVLHKEHMSFRKINLQRVYYHERNRILFIYKNFPLIEILKSLHFLAFMEIRLLRIHMKSVKILRMFFKAQLDGLRMLGEFRESRAERVVLFDKMKPQYKDLYHKKLLPLTD